MLYCKMFSCEVTPGAPSPIAACEKQINEWLPKLENKRDINEIEVNPLPVGNTFVVVIWYNSTKEIK